MAINVKVNYRISFDEHGDTEPAEREIELRGDAEATYRAALKKGNPLNEAPALRGLLNDITTALEEEIAGAGGRTIDPSEIAVVPAEISELALLRDTAEAGAPEKPFDGGWRLHVRFAEKE